MGQVILTPALPRVAVNRRAAARIQSGHPWIFRSDIAETGEAQPGDAVHVESLGTFHYSSTSQIALRLLSRKAIHPGAEFFLDRLRAAQALRQNLGSVYRLVHAEADFLPALVIDRYGDYFTLQALNQGMDRATPLAVSALIELFTPKGIMARNDAAVRTQESLPRENRVLHGEVPATIELELNGLHLHADLAHGQKTGIYLDQRENYAAVARHAHGRALDCFTSTGGFALHMAAHCEHVDAIDSSASAIAAARRNAHDNALKNIDFREADVFEFLSSTRKRYSTVVLDPPAFAKSRTAIERALTGYKEINLRALKLLEPGGILVSCSCSHHVSEADLLEVIAQASLDAGRTLRVLERRTQSSDHPILLTVPETHYLKCLILQTV